MPEQVDRLYPPGLVYPQPASAAPYPPQPEPESYPDEFSDEGDSDEVVTSPAPVPESEKPDDFSDITGLSADDEDEIFGTDDLSTDGSGKADDDFSDILEVDNEDIMGPDPEKQRQRRAARKAQAFRRTPAPPTSMGGMNYG